MRSAFTFAAFAAGALAVPYNKERDLVTDVNVVYVTDVVTVTAGQLLPSEAPKVPHFGHHHHAPAPEIHTSIIQQVPAPVPSSQAAAPPPKQAAAPASSAPAAAPTSYQEKVVYHHNIHRQNHSVADLSWDDGLASIASEIASSCVYAHNTEAGGGGYGQNIAAGVESDNITAVITDLFYNGEEPLFAPNYGASDPDMSSFEGWGHFTQIVWASTSHVGCATQYCPNGLGNVGSGVSPYFTVCNYKNPGNYAGEYGANVKSPKGHPTAQWNTGLGSY